MFIVLSSYNRQSMNAGAVLQLAGNVIRKGCVLTVPTLWTDFDLRAVLGHLQSKLRQAARPLLGVRSGQEVMDLPRHLSLDRHSLPVLPTGAAPVERERHDLIWMLRHLERLAGMTTLSARRPAGLLALTLGCPGVVFARWLTDVRLS